VDSSVLRDLQETINTASTAIPKINFIVHD
jgi:hypothetical protein